jgi:tetratricopeptide (TPR) repeat protein
MARIRVPGARDPRPAAPDLGELGIRGGRAENVQAVQVGAARAAESQQQLAGLAPDTIVELTLDTGARFYHRYDQLAEDMRRAATRGGDGAPDTIDLPVTLFAPLSRAGVGASAIESVRTFDLDLSALGDFAGGLAGKPLAETFDGWRRDSYGLRPWSLETGALGGALAAGDLTAGDALLLFIHGTGSSTSGGFGPLAALEPGWTDGAGATATAKLRGTYSDRVLAFDHPTLSVSPIDNAIALLGVLPGGARLHVVSHSRGGMIGELICRAQRSDGQPPFAGELEALKRLSDRGQRDCTAEIAKLEELGRLLRDRRPAVERFVRVACPAAGTTLASGRLDRWLSVVTSALDLSGLGASQVYRFLKGFLLAVVKSRTDPRSVPGLEAMLPNSLLTMVLNRPGVETSADLSVIAGDIEGTSILARLGFQVIDWYYGGDHDLVVDTVSMYGGLARKNKAARFFFDRGGNVSHFNYFRNEKTLDKLVRGLLRSDDDEAEFQRLDRQQEISAFLAARRGAGPQPAAFVVPHCMGSHLEVSGKRIWIDLAALARGDFCKLALAPGSAGVTAEALVADAYAPLVKHLAQSHEVVPFAYDWRLSLAGNGGRFAAALRARLAANATEPVRIVAHGSGGLVVLMACAADKELAAQFAARDGARIVLLDIPLRGSTHVARLLLGQHRLSEYLALLGLEGDDKAIVDAFRSFPGLVELLPSELLDPTVWAGLAQPTGMRPPAEALLKQARESRTAVTQPDFLRTLPLTQINGTPALSLRMAIENAQVRFYASAAPAQTSATVAIPGGTWWAPAEPGELATFKPGFDACYDLLTTGATTRLPNEPPSFTSALTDTVELPPDMPQLFPDEQELTAAALSYARRPSAPPERKTTVHLVHGNLAFARWPVAVGHYAGDTLAGSEEQLDRALNGRLAHRRDLRIYPGSIGSAEIVLDRAQSPRGAVVIGLGPVGELTPGQLRRALSQALRRYALAVQEAKLLPAGEMGISTILIGSGEGGIRTADALSVLLDALRYANSMLGDDAFTDVEIIELYQDNAIETAHVLKQLEVGSPGPYKGFSFDGLVHARKGGRRQSAPREDPTWWRRLQIREGEDGQLVFTDLTDRARLPQSPVASRHKVDAFVRRAVTEISPPDNVAATGPLNDSSASEALYELLLPARFKDEARDDRARVLVLDTVTASYPWELLRRPGRGDGKPLSVRAGMIRQLTEPGTSDRSIVTTGRAALVVGNPPSGLAEFPSLAGASEEARLVAAMLKKSRFDVAAHIERKDNLAAILCGRWRVMHLAGHGAVGFVKDGRRFTGMVLEDGLFFEPADVKQMEAIPELVFLNCCYLGSSEPDEERKATALYHELAANIGTAFIKLGVRAVVAAGWAVDDQAAKLFAQVFYQSLLAGETFGNATHAARKDVHEQFGHTNTWGAYQCYGDPGYRLFRDGAQAETARAPQSYVHVQEAITDIQDIAQDALTLATRDPAPLRERLRSIATALEGPAACWRGDPELQACLGQAYANLGMYQEAIAAYALALRAETASAPIYIIEQLANLRARCAVQADDSAAARKEIEHAIALVDGLPRYGPDGDHTSERWSLLGNCYKRLAQRSDGQERICALTKMSGCYAKAFDRSHKDGTFDTDSLLNRLLAETLMELFEAPPARQPCSGSIDADEWLRRAEQEARTADTDDPSFSNGVPFADIALGRALLRRRLDESVQQEVVGAYLRPWRRGASALEFASVLEQFDFLIQILGGESPEQHSDRSRLRAALRAIAAQLRAATGVA